MNRSEIEWTDYTWNPVTGCLHGCPYCYARKIARRFPKNFPNGFTPTFWLNRIDEPKALKKPAMIFTVSMGDMFGKWVPYEWQKAILDTINECPEQTFQILTKDPLKASQVLTYHYIQTTGEGCLPENLWIGTSIDRGENLFKLAHLRGLIGGKRFVSFEPLLTEMPPFDLVGYDWVIIGAQTNPRKNPEPEWVRGIIDTARDAGCKVFLKDSVQDWWPDTLREFPAAGGAR